MGDVKLAGMMGLFLGAAVAPAILIALLAGVLARRGPDRPQGRAGGPQDRRSVRSLPRARGAARRFRRAADRRCLRQSLPSLKRVACLTRYPTCGRSPARLKRPTRDATPLTNPPAEHEASSSVSAAAAGPTSSAWTSSPASWPPSRRASTDRSSPSSAATLPLPADTVRDGEVMDEDALSEVLRELFGAERSEQARSRRRRQPAHGAAHARAAPRHRPEGARGGGPLPGPGPGADAAQQRRHGLPPARRRRHTRWSPSARRARGRPARHDRTTAQPPCAAPA